MPLKAKAKAKSGAAGDGGGGDGGAPKLSKKQRAALKLEEERRREAAMGELRGRVQALLNEHAPPPPLAAVTAALPELQRNPWKLVHDQPFTLAFFDNLISVLREHAAPLGELARRAAERRARLHLRALEAEAAEEQSRRARALELQQQEAAAAATAAAAAAAAAAASQGEDPSRRDDAETQGVEHEAAAAAAAATDAAAAVALGSAEAEAKLAEFKSSHDEESEEAAAAAAAAASGAPDDDAADPRTASLSALLRALQDLGAFAASQPAFFFTEPRQLAQVVELLRLSLSSEHLFTCVLALLSTTARHAALAPLLEASGVIAPLMAFFQRHIARGGDVNEASLRALLKTLKHLSAAPQLRQALRASADAYLQLRALAAGAAPGLSKQQQEYALASLQHFVEDSEAERLLLGATARGANGAMLRYWRGHAHRLYCEGLAGDAAASTPLAPVSALAGRSRARKVKAGFADQQSLDALNRVRQRRGAAAAAAAARQTAKA
jgi:hypothetical protein